MAGETPEAWLGREVVLHVWKSDDLERAPNSRVAGIDSFGETVEGVQQHRVTFYPWSTVREIVLGQDSGSR